MNFLIKIINFEIPGQVAGLLTFALAALFSIIFMMMGTKKRK